MEISFWWGSPSTSPPTPFSPSISDTLISNITHTIQSPIHTTITDQTPQSLPSLCPVVGWFNLICRWVMDI
uniref:Uncharacterized protein n=1 Tax=Helianthus annuus TaxID=4232 RepID=A0A251V895_HELAN